jgi:signal transduction histidine kinase
MGGEDAASEDQARKLIAAIEQERRAVGEELHDTLCQSLAGTTLILDTIGRAIAAGKPVSVEAFETLKRILEESIDQARSLSRRFDPVMLEGAGLMTALQALAMEVPNCEFVCERPVFINNAETALTLFRIAEGSLPLSLKNEEVGKTRLELAQQGEEVLLRISTAGKALARVHEDASISKLMQLHAHSVGGNVTLEQSSNNGTVLTCVVPLRP